MDINIIYNDSSREESSTGDDTDQYPPPVRAAMKEFKGKGYGEFKKSLAKVLINYLEPFRRKQKELQTRDVYVKDILSKGASRAKIIAETTMKEVREKMGLI